MSLLDLCKIAIADSKDKWAVIVAIGIAIGAFCLCFSGAVFFAIQQEKSQPFELIATTQSASGINDTLLVDMLGIEGIEDATPVLEIPVEINMGGYMAELVLTGVKPSYIDEQSRLPENSIMPYIVLNKAACKAFKKAETAISTETESPNIDWPNEKALITMPALDAPITGRICGIRENTQGDEAIAYISLNTAKMLLRSSGQTPYYQLAYVRLENMGCLENVSRKLMAMGLSAANADSDLLLKWDSWNDKMLSLFIVGGFAYLCAGLALYAKQKLSLAENKDSYQMLNYLGMRKKSFHVLFGLQAIIVSLIGSVVGILASNGLPSFLAQELRGNSLFMLPIPPMIWLIVWGLGTAICYCSYLPVMRQTSAELYEG